MKESILAALTCSISMALHAISPIAGQWAGSIDVGSANLSIIFNISEDDAGHFSATMDSPDQGAKDIESQIKVVGTDSVIIKIPTIGFKYNGKVVGDRMYGKINQLGRRFQLDMKRGAEKINRPQTPTEITYTTEEVNFDSADKTHPAILSGTLTYPEGYGNTWKKDKPAVVVMVSGSGLQDRDETVFDHKPFAVIADRLAKSGIASLRYDDRGYGKSTGDNVTATTMTNAADAEGAVKYLRETGKFSKVGILGHSEGGSIAFIEGAKGIPDFIVTIGAPAFSGDSIVTAQVNRALADVGSNERISVTDYRTKYKSQIEGNPWLAFFVDYDPSSDIGNTRVPVFAIGGELDVQVPGSSNIPEIARLLPKNKKNQTRVYPGLNHLMQPAQTGQVTEYRKIETTISENVLSDIICWIKTVCK